MKQVALVAASGGIGRAMLAALATRDDIACIHATYHRADVDTIDVDGTVEIRWHQLDATDDAAVERWLGDFDSLDWLINASGFLHDDAQGPEKNVRQMSPSHFEKSMRINCLTTLLLAKHAADLLKRSDAGLFAAITAKVGSIEDNRLGGWYSYRASKAAANMAIKTIAIEWSRVAKRVRVLALHPGTVDTALSEPFQGNVPEEQLFTPEKSARLLIARLDEAHDHDSGRFIAYDGEVLPW